MYPTLASTELMKRLPHIVHVCADVLTELDGDGATEASERFVSSMESCEGAAGMRESGRKREVFLRDVVGVPHH